jgi:hypothetical protein
VWGNVDVSAAANEFIRKYGYVPPTLFLEAIDDIYDGDEIFVSYGNSYFTALSNNQQGNDVETSVDKKDKNDSIKRMNENDTNENFIQIKKALLNKFETLDKILEEIWKEKGQNDRSYNDNDINQIKGLAQDYADYLNIACESDKNSILKLFDNLAFENRLIGFKKSIEDTKNIENGSEILLRRILPYFYELKKRTCLITSLSGPLRDRVLERTFLYKIVTFLILIKM